MSKPGSLPAAKPTTLCLDPVSEELSTASDWLTPFLEAQQGSKLSEQR